MEREKLERAWDGGGDAVMGGEVERDAVRRCREEIAHGGVLRQGR